MGLILNAALSGPFSSWLSLGLQIVETVLDMRIKSQVEFDEIAVLV